MLIRQTNIVCMDVRCYEDHWPVRLFRDQRLSLLLAAYCVSVVHCSTVMT
jgi:hypothetical protein